MSRAMKGQKVAKSSRSTARLRDCEGRAVGEAAFLNELIPGRRLGLYYEDDPGVWHEVVVVARTETGAVMITPDGDEYEEDVACVTGQGPVRAVLASDRGRVPRDLGGKFYRFKANGYPPPEVLKAKLGLLEGEYAVVPWGKQGVSSLGKRFNLPPPAPVTPPALEGDYGAAGRELAEHRPGQSGLFTPTREERKQQNFDLATPVQEVDHNHAWVTIEEVEGLPRHSVIILGGSDFNGKTRGVHYTREGVEVCVKRVRKDEVDELEPGRESDLRILEPVRYDVKGTRYQSFSDSVARMREETLADFPLRNTRSLRWLLNYVVNHGLTFDGRQTKWAAEQRIESESATYVMHDLIGFAIELGATYDQLDLCNLASFEVLGRLYQMIEETRGSLCTEGFEHFIGRDATGGLRRGVALAPGLASDAISQQAKEVEILKQRRKAKEEKALVAAGKKGDHKPKNP